jgi:hypothetical protein
MPRIFVYLPVCIWLLSSCTSAIKNNNTSPPDELQGTRKSSGINPIGDHGNTNLVVENESDLIGYWVGMFEPDTDIAMEGIYAGEKHAWDYSNKINISIDEIRDQQVRGHSVVAGNNRPFKGKMTMTPDGFAFQLNEPGDDKYDGVFTFTVNTGDSILQGTWKANKKIRISSRKYSITKKIFRYNPGWQMKEGAYVDWTKKKKVLDEIEEEAFYDDSYFTTTDDVLKYNASKELLTKAQVSNLKKADLFVMRNAIYARHGYSFKNQQLRAYFDGQPWYIPVSTDVKAAFTEIEKKNIELLLRYEKNAKEYYDVFGRG